MKRITIKDLARMLNLSTSTISRALSDHPDISEATKNRVRKTAEEFHYSMNVHARFFRNQRSRLIGLILPEINMFFTPNLIRGINKTIASSNYSLIIFQSNDSFKKEKEIVKQCLNWALEGVMISLSKETYNLDHLEPLNKADIKCILLDKAIENDSYPSVTIDSTAASYEATSYLIKKNHHNILGLFGNPKLNISQERILGFEKAMLENNIPIIKENIICVEKSSDLEFILPPILRYNKDLSAVFTMSDELHAKSLYHIKALDLKVPENISIISISDGVYPYLTHPQTSHIKDSGSKMGRIASKLLIKLITDPAGGFNSGLLVSTKLIELGSVKERLS